MGVCPEGVEVEKHNGLRQKATIENSNTPFTFSKTSLIKIYYEKRGLELGNNWPSLNAWLHISFFKLVLI